MSTSKRLMGRVEPERPQLRRTGLSDARLAGEPAYATLNVADWQGSAPPPYDPLGFRADVGAAEGGGRLRYRVPNRTDGCPAAVGHGDGHRGDSLARYPARLGAGPLGVEGAEPLVSAPPGTREVWPRGVCWLPAKTGREPALADALEAVAEDTLRTVPGSGVRGAVGGHVGGLEAVETRSPPTP